MVYLEGDPIPGGNNVLPGSGHISEVQSGSDGISAHR
jgi:hypothetical protein